MKRGRQWREINYGEFSRQHVQPFDREECDEEDMGQIFKFEKDNSTSRASNAQEIRFCHMNFGLEGLQKIEELFQHMFRVPHKTEIEPDF